MISDEFFGFDRAYCTTLVLLSGSHLEIEYSLLSFGISCQRMMQDGDEHKKLTDWYFQSRADATEKKRRAEKEPRPDGRVVYPTLDDALIGRGHPFHDVPGTRRLLELVESLMDRYNQSDDRFWKTCMGMEGMYDGTSNKCQMMSCHCW
jgi:hypothetical protein